MRKRQGFAALDPQRRSTIASLGGIARKHVGRYSINTENAKELARRRWNLADERHSEQLACRLNAALNKLSIAELARRARLARSTIRDARGGRRVTAQTALALERALVQIEQCGGVAT